MSAPDPFGALLVDPFVEVPGRPDGPLAGATFVAKDLLDVAGTVTGAGQPTWAATHGPASAHAPAVQRLLDAGATLVGRAHTAEMAYSLSGADVRAGMPRNPRAPGHDPGGSSSGAAVAVAGGLADLGLATDTLGSIRVPASYCGVFGWRPTHGRVPRAGVHPLAPSLDTVGLLARDPGLLHRGAQALVGTSLGAGVPTRVLLAAEAFSLVDPGLRAALADAADAFGPTDTVDLTPDRWSLAELTSVVRDVQGPEFAAAHRAWIEAETPRFTPGVTERIAHALQVGPEAHAAAVRARAELAEHLATVLGPGDVVLLPAAGRPARRTATDGERADARRIAASLSVAASLGGLPTVTVPAVVVDGTPVGLSLLAAPAGDGLVLGLASDRPPVPPSGRPGRP